jgi:hypothetical protein
MYVRGSALPRKKVQKKPQDQSPGASHPEPIRMRPGGQGFEIDYQWTFAPTMALKPASFWPEPWLR